ncbi:MAG: hypothetical protein KDD70_17115 [Bdellovibrionales bacterium]|nr:hypothetical protein [Bdellovibrionales bacterium]
MVKIILPLLIGISLFVITSPAAHAATKNVCQSATGDLLVRRRCKGTETQLSLTGLFSSTGIPGPAGAAGAHGPAGVAGDQGAKGPIGSTGPTGSLGVENCRIVNAVNSNFFSAATSLLSAAPLCNSSTEYLLTYSFDTNAVHPLMQNPDPALIAPAIAIDSIGGAIPYGIDVTAKRITTSSVFVLSVDAVCCPRG